jgi:hypothetical protein
MASNRVPYLVIAYYTADTPYREEARMLEATLDALRLPYMIRAYPSRGSWELNCGIKPEFIGDMQRLHPAKDLLYVDVDARFHSVPEFPWPGDVGRRVFRGAETLSGTLYFRATAGARRAVELWRQEQERFPVRWDQVSLACALAYDPAPCSVFDLPVNYVRIFGLDAGEPGDPVIMHYQASRRLKNQIRRMPCASRI